MDYLNVLDHIKEVKVDRIILSDFETDWVASDEGTTLSLVTDHATVFEKSLLIPAMAKDSYIYTIRDQTEYESREKKVFRLDDRENIFLHIYSATDIPAESLELVLSDSKNLTTTTLALDIPKITAGSVNVVELDIEDTTSGTKTDNARKLSNITTVGLRALAAIAAPFYVALCNATTTDYIITVEDLEEKIIEGEDYVLAKLGPDHTTIPDSNTLQGAVFLAAAAYQWMKQKENEQYQFDYGNQYTKNHGVHLLSRAKMLVNSYMAGGDAETTDGSTAEKSYINTSLIGGHSLNHRHHHHHRRRF